MENRKVDTTSKVLNGHPAARSAVDLVQQASDQIGRLVRAEIALARAELTEKGRQAAAGAALLAAAGILALLGTATLVAALVAALALKLPPWAAAATVAAALLAVAVALVLVAKSRLAGMRALAPTAALDSVRADVDKVRHALVDRGPGAGAASAGPEPAVVRPLAKAGARWPGSDGGRA